MGCIKSSPSAVADKTAEQKKERAMPVQKKSKQDNSNKVLVFDSAVQSKNQKGGGKGALEGNNPSRIEAEDEDESVVSSRKNARKNRGKPDQSYIEKPVENQEKQFYGVVEDHNLIDDEDENALKKQVQMGQIEQQQQQQQQHPLQQPVEDKKSIAEPSKDETSEALKELTSANELKAKDDLEENEEEYQQTPKKTENTEKTDTGDNYQCSVLRAQPTIASQFSMHSRTNGSISMQTSGQRLTNSNIITSGFDYEKKRRELIRKISDEIDEIDEIDENTFQIGTHGLANKQSDSKIQGVTKMIKTESIFDQPNEGQIKMQNVQKIEEDEDF